MIRFHALKSILPWMPMVLLAVFLRTGAFAQEKTEAEPLALDPVVVTAEKRADNVQDVPSSISAFSDTDIQDAGITTIQRLSRVVPNLYIANWGIRGTSYVFVRGIGAVNNDPAVGFYVDDVGYMDARAFDTNLYDIERIEVLRGPQGTLYGRNSLSGVINIVTKKPDNDTLVGAAYSTGNYELHQSNAYMRTPVIDDKLFFGFAAGLESRDGFTDNTYLSEDVDSRQSLNGRMKLYWTPSEKLDVSLGLDGERMNDGAFPLGNLHALRENPHEIAYDHEGEYERDVIGANLRLAYDAPRFRLTSITAFRIFDDTATNDQDFTIYPLITAGEEIDDDQFTQELRFASPDGTEDLEWLVGLYGFKKDKYHFLNLNFAADVVMPGMAVDRNTDSDMSTYGGALFGQATYTLFDKLDFTAGFRYDYEKSKIDHVMDMVSGDMAPGRSAFSESETNDAWLPKFQVAYRFAPGFMTYAGISRGYRSGGFNTAFVDASDMAFGPEYSWNYEVGSKSSWFGNRLLVNAALFYIDIDDQQVVQLLPSADTAIRNAGKSRSMGFEVESKTLISRGLTLEAGFGYTDAEFVEYEDTLAGFDYSGNEVLLAPEYTYNLALQYYGAMSDKWSFFVRTELNGIGDFYWDDANTLKQDAYQLLNMKLGFESEGWDLVAWARNLLDEEYESVAFEFPGSDPVGQSGDPFTAGITFRLRFP